VGLAYVSVANYDYKLTFFEAQVLVYFIDTELARVVVLAFEGALKIW
jgi:hypothetical protein